MPLEAIGDDVKKTLARLDQTLAGARGTLEKLDGTLGKVDTTVGSANHLLSPIRCSAPRSAPRSRR